MDNRYRNHEQYDIDDIPPRDEERYWQSDPRAVDVRDRTQAAIRRARGGRRRRRFRNLNISAFAKQPRVLIGALIAGIAVLGLVAYLLVNRTPARTAAPQTPPAATSGQPNQAAQPDSGESFLTQVFGAESRTSAQQHDVWYIEATRILFKLSLAALLASLLAYRKRKDLPDLQRNPLVAQTQILLAVVAAALMMIVADNAARAFGIFAAASLVRFRTNIRDPKEITVLLVSLGLGLASGVGRFEVAIVLALFVMLMLWVLEYYEPATVHRTMELCVKTRNVDSTDEVLKDLFYRREIHAEIRRVDLPDEDNALGQVTYLVTIEPSVSTDQLSEEIFAADPQNVDSIYWDQKKNITYAYK